MSDEARWGRIVDSIRAAIGDGKSRRFTPHGFRATASTLLHETGIESRLIELQLAHQDRNQSRDSYDHSARLPERRQMMQAYADLLGELMQSRSNVVPLRAAPDQAAHRRRRPPTGPACRLCS